MDDKIYKLIVSNKIETDGKNGIIYVHLNNLFEYKKQYTYLTFNSDIWKQPYFLPLGHINNNKMVSRLNSFKLIEENFGINLEEILKTENLSLYSFLDKNYKLMNQQDFYNDTFVVKTSELLHTMLYIPIENTVRILKWIDNANYTHQTSSQLLLTTFKAEKI